MSKQKGSALIFLLVGILVAVGIAGGAFYLGRSTTPQPSPIPAVTSQTLQPTPSLTPIPTSESTSSTETANWKTYEDRESGISFKYPADLVIQPYQFEGNKAFHPIIQLNPVNQKLDGPAPSRYAFAYWDNSDNLSLEQFERKYTGNSGIGPGLYSDKSITTTIAGVTTYYQKDAVCEPVYCDRYTIPYKNKIFSFVIFYNSNSEEKAAKRTILNQILSTFKFTN